MYVDSISTRYHGVVVHSCPKDPTCQHCRREKDSFGWDSLVDAVYCICIDSRDDRMSNSAVQFHEAGLCNKVLYYRPELDTSTHTKRPGTRGCWESHRAVYQHAKDNKHKRILVLEDDVVFDTDRMHQRLFDSLSKFLHTKNNWDILLLGYLPLLAVPTVHKHVSRVIGGMGHAYVVNVEGKFFDWVVQTSFDSLSTNAPKSWLDKIMRYDDVPYGLDAHFSVRAKLYGCRPQIAWQSDSASNNLSTAVVDGDSIALTPFAYFQDQFRKNTRLYQTVGEWTSHCTPIFIVLVFIGVLNLCLSNRRSSIRSR